MCKIQCVVGWRNWVRMRVRCYFHLYLKQKNKNKNKSKGLAMGVEMVFFNLALQLLSVF